MKYTYSAFAFILILLMGFGEAQAQSNSQNDTIRVARATWDTGWFQTEVFRLIIEDMGYTVAPAQTMTAENFYRSAADGSMDFWVNGWFPLHQPVIKPFNENNALRPVGYEVERGALQGYLMDLGSAHELQVESLAELKDPQLAQHFDLNGNGKADLIGCNSDWSCHTRIEKHLEKLDLNQTVEQISGDYTPLARDAIDEWKKGRPLLMYTWTPNWTLGEVIPGEDVQWLHVPVQGQELVSDLKGAAKDPINLGYDLNDIRVVANDRFLQEHPALDTLFSRLSIPLEDIQHQNAKMVAGEGRLQDIRDHARQWIENNKDILREIFEDAGLTSSFQNESTASDSPYTTGRNQYVSETTDEIRVVTQQVEPLVVYENNTYSGFSIDVFEAIADELGLEYSIYSVNSIAKMLDDVRRGEADVATAALGITSEREQMLDFSHPYYDTGLQILIPKKESTLTTIPKAILSIIFSKEILFIFLFFFGVLLLSAHIIWFAERKHNDDFPDEYWRGLGVSIWWAAVTVTTVGYGDKTPKGIPGRLFGLIWIFAGYFAFSYFTATVTSTVTLQEIEGNIQQVEDLHGKSVATVSNSSAQYYLAEIGINADPYETIQDAIARLQEDDAEAVVYDAPVLQHYASGDGYGKVELTGSTFQQQSYGFALRKNSELRKALNLGYLKLVENGEYQEIRNRWFGN